MILKKDTSNSCKSGYQKPKIKLGLNVLMLSFKCIISYYALFVILHLVCGLSDYRGQCCGGTGRMD